ncbi:MAG: MATE family efflux transporter, partial [Bacteroidota bacterium]|nr:MATE family efflux transporter [Bacteroidota bacterium]
GKFGLEPMGIRGAAWASNISEVVSLAVFIAGLLYQRLIPRLKIFHFKAFSCQLFSQINWTSLPLIFQAIVALTTWFLFFTLVERKLGSTAWAASGPVKNLYTLFGVTSYAFASTTNTAIGNLVGKEAYDEIIPTIKRMVRLSLLVAIGVTIPVLLMPRTLLLWITTPELVEVGLMTLYISMVSLWMYSIGTIFFNAIVGLGQTAWSLVIEIVSCIGFIAFLILLFYGINCTSLAWGWSSEIVYWILTGGLGMAWFKWFFPKAIEQIKNS